MSTAAAPAAPAATQLPKGSERILISIAVMLATVMQVLDMTIVNVALPHMMGSLSTNADQITWVLTSYLVAAAIFTPLTGYFTNRLGQKRFLLISIVGFISASVLCGLAQNLTEIVLFRLLQGIFGAPLVPLSQSIMSNAFPPEQRGRAMAFWGMGVMAGPIMGPTLGGYLTQTINWRWVFLINLPVGLLSFFMVWSYIRETPKREVQTDWIGLGLMALGIGAMQLVLDRGNQEDWFSSYFILAMAVLSGLSLIIFVARGWNYPHNIVNLKLFKDRNFATATVMMGVFGLGLFGTVALQPLLLQELLNYPVFTSGLVIAPRGIATMFSMLVVSRLIVRFDPRVIIGTGMIVAGLGTYFMTDYDLNVSMWWVIWPGLLQGLGLGFIFVPLSAMALETIPRQSAAEAAGLFSLFRTVGSAVGISVANTVLSHQNQVTWNEIGAHVQPFNPALADWLTRMHMSLQDPQTIALLGQQVAAQARMLAFVDVFWMIALSFVVMLPLLVFMRRPAHQQGGHAPVSAME